MASPEAVEEDEVLVVDIEDVLAAFGELALESLCVALDHGDLGLALPPPSARSVRRIFIRHR